MGRHDSPATRELSPWCDWSWESERGGARGLQMRSLDQTCLSQKSPRRRDGAGRVEGGGAQAAAEARHSRLCSSDAGVLNRVLS